jgi:hypothetical protein
LRVKKVAWVVLKNKTGFQMYQPKEQAQPIPPRIEREKVGCFKDLILLSEKNLKVSEA